MRIHLLILCILSITLTLVPSVSAADSPAEREEWKLIPDYSALAIRTIAVLPIDNHSLEPGREKQLHDAIYNRLKNKGYTKVSEDRVAEVMRSLGIQTPGQLAGISLKRLGSTLNTDAVLFGQIDQAGSVHTGVYDAVVVSCSLRLVHCATGQVLWETSQWRTAHRQWQLDPINALINLMAHEGASRGDRIDWLAEQMLKTLPDGPITVVRDTLLDKAVEVSP